MNGSQPSPPGNAALEAVISRVRSVYGRWRRDTPIAQMREDWEHLFKPWRMTQPLARASAYGVDVAWINQDASSSGVVIYFHGGGFKIGSVLSHWELMRDIGEAAGCRVLGVDYRRAPEHLFPAAVEDAVMVWTWLVAQGVEPRSIVLAGDSAGACLALNAMFALRSAGGRMPAAAVLMSPWTDLSAAGESYQSRAEADPIHQRAMILATARDYLGPDQDPRDPKVSPLFADLTGLPPLLIQVGDRETVLSDAVDFTAKARAAGVTTTLQIWPDMIHVFQQFARELPEARDALRSIGRFISDHVAAGAQSGTANA